MNLQVWLRQVDFSPGVHAPFIVQVSSRVCFQEGDSGKVSAPVSASVVVVDGGRQAPLRTFTRQLGVQKRLVQKGQDRRRRPHLVKGEPRLVGKLWRELVDADEHHERNGVPLRRHGNQLHANGSHHAAVGQEGMSSDHNLQSWKGFGGGRDQHTEPTADGAEGGVAVQSSTPRTLLTRPIMA